MFSFEKMIAWQKGIEFVDQVFDVADRVPQKYQFSLGEQLRRETLRITNNLAEGVEEELRHFKETFTISQRVLHLKWLAFWL